MTKREREIIVACLAGARIRRTNAAYTNTFVISPAPPKGSQYVSEAMLEK